MEAKRKHIIYKEEFRRQAVEMVIHSGKTQAQVARELGCSAYSLNLWKKVAWLSPGHPEFDSDQPVFRRAPEICIEILSPSNFAAEMAEKRALYFDAGAREVWMCNLDGSITFFVEPDTANPGSLICPAFPNQID
jgi:transposase-like protein